jgi:hypothetical protein
MLMRWVGMIVVPLSLACAMLDFAPREASAAIVEIAVSGRIGVDDRLTLLPDEIHTGEPWTGMIRYDLDIADTAADPTMGYYFDEMRPDGLSITVNVHGHTFYGGNGELQAQVLNDIVLDPGQVINYPAGDSFAIGGPMSQSPRLLDTSRIFFYWHDATGMALLGDDLPTSINPFDFIQSGLTFSTDLQAPSPIYIVIYDIGLSTPEQTSFYLVVASIESAEIRIVPEPTTLTSSLVTVVLIAASRSMKSFSLR